MQVDKVPSKLVPQSVVETVHVAAGVIQLGKVIFTMPSVGMSFVRGIVNEKSVVQDAYKADAPIVPVGVRLAADIVGAF